MNSATAERYNYFNCEEIHVPPKHRNNTISNNIDKVSVTVIVTT